jgi:hypothetical protein
MKNKNLFIVAALVVSLGFALIIFQIHPVDLESVLYLVKVVFIYVGLVIAALFCMIILTYSTLAEMSSKTMRKYDNVEHILLDMRDGTRLFHQEKRRLLRIKIDISARFTDKSAEDDYVSVTDISGNGLRMRTTRVLKAGDVIGFNMHLPLFAKPIHVKAEVIAVRATAETKWDTTVFEAGVEYRGMSLSDKEKLSNTLRILKNTSKHRQQK